MLNLRRAALVEYSLTIPPLAIEFDLNPQRIDRTRTVELPPRSTPPGARGYDFTSPRDVPRVAQGVTVQPETFTVQVLLDAADQPHNPLGVEPQLDVLRAMVEPKTQGPAGVQVLSGLGLGGRRAFQRDLSAAVLLFIWGTHVLPVFLTSVRVNEVAHLPSLVPYRAEVDLTMQVIESTNPFSRVERTRLVAGAAVGSAGAALSSAMGVF